MLTETQVKNARAVSRAVKLAEPGGLFLQVQPTGAKLWRYRFWLNQKEGVLALGRYPDISLKRARELHQEARKLVAEGINPVHQRHDLEISRATRTFGAIAAAWIAKTAHLLQDGTKRQRKREIKNDLDSLTNRPADEIRRQELSALLIAVEKRAPATARNLRTYLHAIFEHAIDLGFLAANPTPPARLFTARRQAHHPALPASKLPGFLKALDGCNAKPETRIAMLLVMLTACRKVEVTGGKWEEIDLIKMTWTIPASRMKGGSEHWIPLSSQAVGLIEDLRRLTNARSEYLFPNRDDAQRPMATRSLNALMDRLGYGGDSTPHGMRAMFSTHFNSLGSNLDVIERCLAHVPANRVRSAYNRHTYHEERKAMLQAWADHLDRLR